MLTQLSTWKYDPGCLLLIPDPGVKEAPDPDPQTLLSSRACTFVDKI
jgi:hypothetical protein